MKRYSLILCLVLILSLSCVASAQIVLGPPPAAIGGVRYLFVSTTSASSTVTAYYSILPYPLVGEYARTSMGYYTLSAGGGALEFDLQGGTTTLPTVNMTANNFAARLGGLTVNSSFGAGQMGVDLFDMADGTEDGLINLGDFTGSLGSPIAKRTHNFSGAHADFNNIDVTAALQNDLFGGGQTNFSGFILLATTVSAKPKTVTYDTDTPTLTIYPPGVDPPPKGEITVQSLLIGVKQEPGGGFTNADLNDTYWFRNLSFQNFETNSPTANITYGTVIFDGNGNWTGDGTGFDSDGTSDSGPFNGTYNVNSDGSYDFIIKGTPPDPDETLTGHISRDADRQLSVLSKGEVTSGNINQTIIAAVRNPVNPAGIGDINGTWKFRDLEVQNFEEVDREASACTGTFVMNYPNWTADFNCFESDGTTDTVTVSGTYTLTDNTFNFFETGDPAVVFSAYLSRDSNILIFTRGSSSGGEIGMFKGVAFKPGIKNYTNTDLAHAYFFHEISFYDFETVNREAERNFGTINFDGNGNWTSTTQSFASDGSSGSGTASGTYSFGDIHPPNIDGNFTLIVTSDTPNTTFTGHVTAHNDTFIMSRRENVSIDDGGGGGGGGGGGSCFISTTAR